MPLSREEAIEEIREYASRHGHWMDKDNSNCFICNEEKKEMKRWHLRNHFTEGLQPYRGLWVGAEIETHFLDGSGNPISVKQSQNIFRRLCEHSGFKIRGRKNGLITELRRPDGAKVVYELGRQNLELATPPFPAERLLGYASGSLAELYNAAAQCGAYPFFGPVIETGEDLLVIPDERDASWLQLDGRENLAPLARIASVQFTFDAKDAFSAVRILEKLGRNAAALIEGNPYPQEEIWRTYIQNSAAGYKSTRYGIVLPTSLNHYVDLLLEHDAVVNGTLMPSGEAGQDFELFLRSVWWNFRLRRWSDRVCVEVRIFARRDDNQITRDFEALLSIIGG